MLFISISLPSQSNTLITIYVSSLQHVRLFYLVKMPLNDIKKVIDIVSQKDEVVKIPS